MDDLLAEQPLWGVSVLAESQRHIAGRFAMKGRISDRLLFEDIPYARGEASGALLVGGALATLECSTERRVPAGDHTLVIGRVLSAQVPSGRADPSCTSGGATGTWTEGRGYGVQLHGRRPAAVRATGVTSELEALAFSPVSPERTGLSAHSGIPPASRRAVFENWSARSRQTRGCFLHHCHDDFHKTRHE